MTASPQTAARHLDLGSARTAAVRTSVSISFATWRRSPALALSPS
jgi:hypothetical protein